MNKYFFISINVLLILLCFSTKAQNLKLHYNLEFVKDTLTNNVEKRSMVLWSEKQNYIFCSEELLIKDSLKKNNFEYSPVLMDEDIEFMTIKKENSISLFSLVDENLYAVKEDSSILKWDIKRETKKIGNIDCQLATLQYKGRNWEAWFSTKYPITFGPYIFNGLPGAVIELSDTKKNFIFKLSGIKNTKESLNIVINQKVWIVNNVISVTKKGLKKVYLSFYSSPFKKMKEKGIRYMIDEKTGEQQPPPDFDKMTAKAQKYIRDNNNPIEVSEAIKY
jgi:GLPGLI family protein